MAGRVLGIGEAVLFLDAEDNLMHSEFRLELLGPDRSLFHYHTPETMEEAVQILKKAVIPKLGLVVIDGMGYIPNLTETGAYWREMCRKAACALGAPVVFTNQTRRHEKQGLVVRITP